MSVGLARRRGWWVAALPLALACVFAACGGGTARSASTSATATPAAATQRTPGSRRFGNRTPSPDFLTSVAEGTPAPGRRSPAVQTAIAEGTPVPFGRPPALQTSIAEGTPAAFGGGFRVLNILATVLNTPTSQLQGELQAPGATVASVGAAHGFDRAALRQALIAAYDQRTLTQVQNGSLTQAQADQAESRFAANIDALLDGNASSAAPTSGQ